MLKLNIKITYAKTKYKDYTVFIIDCLTYVKINSYPLEYTLLLGVKSATIHF